MNKEYTLTGVDGNALSIVAYVARAMRQSGYSKDDISAYQTQAMSDNYEHLVSVSMDTIDQVNEAVKELGI